MIFKKIKKCFETGKNLVSQKVFCRLFCVEHSCVEKNVLYQTVSKLVLKFQFIQCKFFSTSLTLA